MKYYRTIQIDGKQKRLHRYIMECYLGRELNSRELVHHKDNNIFNNKIKNLEILTRGEHIEKHRNVMKKEKKYKINKEQFKILYYIDWFSANKISQIMNIPLYIINAYIGKNNHKRIVKCIICGKEIRQKVKNGYCGKCYHRIYMRGYRLEK